MEQYTISSTDLEQLLLSYSFYEKENTIERDGEHFFRGLTAKEFIKSHAYLKRVQEAQAGVWVKASERLPKSDSNFPIKIDGMNRLGNFFQEDGKMFLNIQGAHEWIIDQGKFHFVYRLEESPERPKP